MKNRFILASHHPTTEGHHYCLKGRLKKVEFVDVINVLSIRAVLNNGDDIIMAVPVDDVTIVEDLLKVIEEYKNANKPYELTYFKFMQYGYAISISDKLTNEEKLHTPFSLLPVKRFYFINDDQYFNPKKNNEIRWEEVIKSSKKFGREKIKLYESLREDSGFKHKQAFEHTLYISNSICIKRHKDGRN